MKTIEIVAKCVNCKHCRPNKHGDNYSCSKGRWHDKYYNQDLCEEWKPSPRDMRLWLHRAANNG